MNDDKVEYRRNPFQKRFRDALEKGVCPICSYQARLTPKNEKCPKHNVPLVPKKIIAAFAAWRTGKTDYISIEHIIKRQLYYNPNVLHLIAANTYSQLIDSTLRTVYEKLDWLGIPHIPERLPRTSRPFSLFISSGAKWVEFLCRSMDNFDTVAGTTLGSFWLDEVWNTEKWTYDLALSRLSDKSSKYLQGVLSSTTDEPGHWLYTELVQKLQFDKPIGGGRKPSDVIEIIYGTTYDNAKNLAPGYIEALETSLDPKLFARNVLAKWVSLVQGKMFYQFDRDLNLRDLKFDYNLPLCISSDFNVDPMCWSVWQRHKNELWCIDQIKVTGGADTGLTCDEVIGRYPWCTQFHWYGDASGRSNSTKSKYSDYEIIEGRFRDAGKVVTQHIPFGNPSIRDSANSVNAMLKNNKGIARLFFDKHNCPDVILSVEGCSYKPGTLEKDESKDRDPKSRVKTHFGDTVRYIVEEEFSLRPKVEVYQDLSGEDE